MIWPFFKKIKHHKFTRPDVHLYDLHNHVLFNIDDGAKNIDESIEMLNGFKRLGYKTIAVTPHHNHYAFETPLPKQMKDTLTQLQISPLNPGINITGGAEIMLRDDYLTLLSNNMFPKTGSVFLVEFPHQQALSVNIFEQLIFDSAKKGESLLIAHPERHPDFQNKPHIIERFKDMGALFQLDILSITGQYGNAAEQTAWNLIENNIADVASSDLHSPNQLNALENALNILAEYDETTFIKLVSQHPEYILKGELDRI